MKEVGGGTTRVVGDEALGDVGKEVWHAEGAGEARSGCGVGGADEAGDAGCGDEGLERSFRGNGVGFWDGDREGSRGEGGGGKVSAENESSRCLEAVIVAGAGR